MEIVTSASCNGADFISVDVETANADLASICQIGIVAFRDGVVCQSWQTLVNPEDYFDLMNVSIHGINEYAVIDAPTFPQIHEEVIRQISDAVLVCHTAFDRVAINRVAAKYGLQPVKCTWLDTSRVARRTWSEVSHRGYGLWNIANMLGISYCPHDAAEDARAAGEILVNAMRITGLSLPDWLARVKKPINPAGWKSQRISMIENPEGDLYGNVLVFTGALTISRSEAAQMAADAGCEVADSVNRRTTLLVIGDQDLRRLRGQEKSSKHRRAEELIAQGQAIRILGESDFRVLVGMLQPPTAC